MPTTRINTQDLKYLTKQRTAIEISMATSLYEVYNSQPIIGSLREIGPSAFYGIGPYRLMPGSVVSWSRRIKSSQ